MKAIPCELIFHGSYKEHNMGEFKSTSKAKKYVKSCWDRPYSIKRLKKES